MSLRSLADQLLALLFPDRCAVCRRPGALFCTVCQASLRPYPAATPLPLLDDAAVAFIFEGALQQAIHTFKYDRVRRMAAPLGDLIVARLREHPLPADAIIAVPLHPKRLAERGFNQSEELGRRLAHAWGIPLLKDGLVRCRDTEHQARLDSRARQENVRDAFTWHHTAAPPTRILLVDDVLTTGATLGACAQALLAAGTREVRAVALARSRPQGTSR